MMSPALIGDYGAMPACQISPRHWQGGFPRRGDLLKRAGFDAVALCAREIQPDAVDCAILFPGLEVVHAPIDDAEISRSDVATAGQAVVDLLEIVLSGRRVLVTCAQGKNRSGLVSALLLVARYGLSGADAAAVIRCARPGALTNPSFSRFLDRVSAPRQGTERRT